MPTSLSLVTSIGSGCTHRVSQNSHIESSKASVVKDHSPPERLPASLVPEELASWLFQFTCNHHTERQRRATGGLSRWQAHRANASRCEADEFGLRRQAQLRAGAIRVNPPSGGAARSGRAHMEREGLVAMVKEQ